jgi:hypothetical protein
VSADNGGPAFPTDNSAQVGPATWHYEGMTLRDYFAAKALASGAFKPEHRGMNAATAYECYQMADAMLKAREA